MIQSATVLLNKQANTAKSPAGTTMNPIRGMRTIFGRIPKGESWLK